RCSRRRWRRWRAGRRRWARYGGGGGGGGGTLGGGGRGGGGSCPSGRCGSWGWGARWTSGSGACGRGTRSRAGRWRWGWAAGWRRPAVAMSALGVGLGAEVAAGRPDYIAFFNLPARLVGPVRLLADSNLDWGQDMKALAAWQAEHPDVRLYVAAYGVVRPWFY